LILPYKNQWPDVRQVALLLLASLPDTYDVACWVAEGGDGQAAFRTGRGNDLGAVFSGCAKHLVEAGDVDVGADSGFAGGGQVGAPVPDDMTGTKARLLKAVIDMAIAGDDEHAAMLERGWAARAQSSAEPADFVAAFAWVLTESAERAAELAAAALEGARADVDIAAVAEQLMSQRQVMAAWLVDASCSGRPCATGAAAPTPSTRCGR
jgi:hypothetical protein